MDWGLNISDQSIPPATGTACQQGIVDSLGDYASALVSAGMTLHLDTSGTAIVQGTPLSSLVEETGAGYESSSIGAGLTGPYYDMTGAVYYLSEQTIFAATDDGTDVTGWYVLANTGTAAVLTASVASGGVSGIAVTTPAGAVYQQVPQVHITQSPGTGATAHAVLAGDGTITVVVDTPGTGFVTAPPVTVDPPGSLHGGGKFQNPIPWTAGIAIPCTAAVYGNPPLPVPPGPPGG